MPQPILRAQHLAQQIQFQNKTMHILQDIQLEIFAGEQVAITGRSGSGKSTLLGLLATLDQASSGQLWLCGEPLHELNEEQRAALRLQHTGFVFQSFQLLNHLSALENVLLPLRLQPNFNYAQAVIKAKKLLQQVGLERQIEQTPQVLSGGEQQRVAIARALVTEPKIIFADEPTGNLDEYTAHEVEELLFRLNREMGVTLVVVTHDMDLASQCQRHFILHDGRLSEQQVPA
ncbi:ABC transporter ATP-binding protein [Acinetobacter sp. MB5]|uniref:ABC transporter ATP-binding protein n=1 Tax=Acinetobacter sp. MB5 TaxID=2069438 RepID=UPI000DD07016|nr:ABC transporter ATP-binding protein [Acinetobacter sp. MB5]